MTLISDIRDLILCWRKTFEGAMHRTEVYLAGVDPKDPTLERFPDIKIKKILCWIKPKCCWFQVFKAPFMFFHFLLKEKAGQPSTLAN
jgi:hypothetical protein